MADQGPAGVNSPEWLRRLDLQLALLSVGATDSRSLPESETLLALEGNPLLRTDLNGWIEVDTDGKQMWVEVERN
jgi:beta-lactamase superfamily II metal-dependent hydrolase